MGVSLIRLGNACVEGVGCRVWRGVEPPRVEDYPIPSYLSITARIGHKILKRQLFVITVNSPRGGW
eukprot:scaffold26002_cov146-Skeletonema_marinoi.AAC.2